jgi:predicted DNA-binding protein
MHYVHTSIHFPDPLLLERIRVAARAAGVSPGAFIREAAERAVEKIEKKSAPRGGKKRAA